jgi:dihydroxyacid dehydratase/phosphogluconate dehydratase
MGQWHNVDAICIASIDRCGGTNQILNILKSKGFSQHQELPAVEQATHFYFWLEQLTRHWCVNNHARHIRDICRQKNAQFSRENCFVLVLSGWLLSACAQVKETGRRIGHTTRDAARAIGHGTRDAAKAVGEGVKKVAKSAPDDER